MCARYDIPAISYFLDSSGSRPNKNKTSMVSQDRGGKKTCGRAEDFFLFLKQNLKEFETFQFALRRRRQRRQRRQRRHRCRVDRCGRPIFSKNSHL